MIENIRLCSVMASFNFATIFINLRFSDDNSNTQFTELGGKEEIME